jgi:C1A family cysteine protease
VKIIGWDVKEGKNCWLIENSWGEDWGENGIA